MIELKPCPFCGGKGKVSFKNFRFLGYNGLGHRKVQYRVQVICNKCRSRGKPIITDGMVNSTPYISKWGNCYNEKSEVCQKRTQEYRPYVEQAAEAWNRRAESEELKFTRAFIHEHGLDFALASAWNRRTEDGK